MNRIDERHLEELKEQLRIDEMIAEKYNTSVAIVKKEFDPRLVSILLEYLKQRAQQANRE